MFYQFSHLESLHFLQSSEYLLLAQLFNYGPRGQALAFISPNVINLTQEVAAMETGQ